MDHEKPAIQPPSSWGIGRSDEPVHNPRRRVRTIASLKTYYYLTKPGIIYGNALSLTGGFLLASKWHIDTGLFLAVLIGTCLVIASACVFNNYIDRGIDEKMQRTRRRALVRGKVSAQVALTYGSLLGAGGFLLLSLWTNWLVVLIGVIAYVDYIVLYGYSKRRSVHGTLVGSIAGSAPPVAGYCAVTGRFDQGALIIFLIMTFWQMVHFYAIAIRRAKDYKAAGIPVMPVAHSVRATKVQMIGYTVAFTIAVIALSVQGYAGWVFAVVMGAVGLFWLWKGLHSFNVRNNVAWAKGMFLFSLVVLLTLSAMMSVGSILP
jgi:protoheme IX farnesyltransferase